MQNAGVVNFTNDHMCGSYEQTRRLDGAWSVTYRHMTERKATFMYDFNKLIYG
jgi:hypothetical protein